MKPSKLLRIKSVKREKEREKNERERERERERELRQQKQLDLLNVLTTRCIIILS